MKKVWLNTYKNEPIVITSESSNADSDDDHLPVIKNKIKLVVSKYCFNSFVFPTILHVLYTLKHLCISLSKRLLNRVFTIFRVGRVFTILLVVLLESSNG